MSYCYATSKPAIFTEEGSRLFTGIRDHVRSALNETGAITVGKAMRLPPSIGAADGWTMLACIERLEEIGEVTILKRGRSTQDDVVVWR